MTDFSKFEFISFDCYGTLIDWENGILDVFQKCLGGFESIEKPQVLESFAKWEAHFESGPFLCYREVLNKVYSQMCDEFQIQNNGDQILADSVGAWLPFEDTTRALKQLNEHYKLVVLSNVDADMFELTQQKLGVEFFATCVAEDIGSYKPARRNFEYMLREIDANSSQVLHVAQSLFHDHVPAKEIGMTSVWVNRPSVLEGQGATMPADAKPDYSVASMAELVELVFCNQA